MVTPHFWLPLTAITLMSVPSHGCVCLAEGEFSSSSSSSTACSSKESEAYPHPIEVSLLRRRSYPFTSPIFRGAKRCAREPVLHFVFPGPLALLTNQCVSMSRSGSMCFANSSEKNSLASASSRSRTGITLSANRAEARPLMITRIGLVSRPLPKSTSVVPPSTATLSKLWCKHNVQVFHFLSFLSVLSKDHPS